MVHDVRKGCGVVVPNDGGRDMFLLGRVLDRPDATAMEPGQRARVKVEKGAPLAGRKLPGLTGFPAIRLHRLRTASPHAAVVKRRFGVRGASGLSAAHDDAPAPLGVESSERPIAPRRPPVATGDTGK